MQSSRILTNVLKSTVRRASHVPMLSAALRMAPQPWHNSTRHQPMSHMTDYESKYRSKLEQRAKDEGYSSISDLKHSKLREDPVAEETPGDAGLPPAVKKLDQIMKLDKLADLDGEAISQLWTQYHSTKDMISATIPSETYAKLLARGRRYPMFILPVPRDNQGIEMFLLQFDHHQVHFTPLVEYKTHGSNARPALSLTHYTDLMADKQVVLMRGELDTEIRVVDAKAAQYLALQLQQFYVTGGREKLELVEKFNQRPEEFNYQELITQAETLL